MKKYEQNINSNKNDMHTHIHVCGGGRVLNNYIHTDIHTLHTIHYIHCINTSIQT